MEGKNVHRFDVSRASDVGAHAIADALRLDREHVISVALDPEGRSIAVETKSDDAAGRLEAFINEMIRTQRFVSRRILENRANDPKFFDIDAELISCPDVYSFGDGSLSISGSILRLFRFFEREFLQLAREFNAEEQHYPVLLPFEVIAELRYFENFPHHLTFCSHFRESLALLDSVAKDSNENTPEAVGPRLASPTHVLTPGVCMPCYRQQRGARIADESVRTLTMQNHVFRYEGANFRPLTRAWDFTVRDIVFFGSAENMVRLRKEVIGRALDLCRRLDLQVTIELANDPFFLNASRDKAIYQRLGEVKYELLFELPYRRDSLAASSFNLHRTFYTSLYDTRLESGEQAESACMGFGLERWVYGFLSQKGLNPKGWPDTMRTEVAA